jgi:predicted enzyme related to lactoylglutathione lyase
VIQFAALHITTDRPERLGVFYQGLFGQEPAWSSAEVTGFMLGAFRLEVAKHEGVSGANDQPERLFFDLLVEDVPAGVTRGVALGATVVQAPYRFEDDALRMVIATLADPDGNYFQLVSMEDT